MRSCHGAPEQETLTDIAPLDHQMRRLGGRLYAFGDRRYAQIFRKIDNRPDNSGITRFRGIEARHERPVDLDRVNRKLLQVRQRRIACSEIIQGNRHARRGQRLQAIMDPIG